MQYRPIVGRAKERLLAYYKKIKALYPLGLLYVLIWSLRGLLATRTAVRTFAAAMRPSPATARASGRKKGRRRADESGEGVISAAIAVLVMAFLGVAMWFAFSSMLTTTTNNISHTITKIGQ